MEDAEIPRTPSSEWRLEIELHEAALAKARMPRPGLRNGDFGRDRRRCRPCCSNARGSAGAGAGEVSLLPAFASACQRRSWRRARDFGKQSFKKRGENPAPLCADRAQGPIKAGKFDIAPFDHIDGPQSAPERPVPRYRNLHLTRHGENPPAQKSERPRGEPRPLDGGGGAGSPPQPYSDRRCALSRWERAGTSHRCRRARRAR